MTQPPRSVSGFSISALFAITLAACGGGGEGDALPKNVAELRAAFDTAPMFLCDYFANAPGNCRSINLSTVMMRNDTSKPDTYFSFSLQIQYQGKTIYDEEIVRGVPVAAHGFTSSGEYVIAVNRLYSNAAYASVFVGGQKVGRLETELFRTDFKSIRYIGNDWLVLVTGYFADCGWKLYNLKTSEFRDYGPAACPKSFEP